MLNCFLYKFEIFLSHSRIPPLKSANKFCRIKSNSSNGGSGVCGVNFFPPIPKPILIDTLFLVAPFFPNVNLTHGYFRALLEHPTFSLISDSLFFTVIMVEVAYDCFIFRIHCSLIRQRRGKKYGT